MNAVAVGVVVVGMWVAVGVLLVVFIAAKTSRSPERNALIHARGAFIGSPRSESPNSVNARSGDSDRASNSES